MTDPIETQLATLRDEVASADGLAEMESRVLAMIARRAEQRSTVRTAGLAGLGALAIGIASPALLSSRAAAAGFDPIADVTALAPSTLLQAPRR